MCYIIIIPHLRVRYGFVISSTELQTRCQDETGSRDKCTQQSSLTSVHPTRGRPSVSCPPSLPKNLAPISKRRSLTESRTRDQWISRTVAWLWLRRVVGADRGVEQTLPCNIAQSSIVLFHSRSFATVDEFTSVSRATEYEKSVTIGHTVMSQLSEGNSNTAANQRSDRWHTMCSFALFVQ